jgi:hypothetical protein
MALAPYMPPVRVLDTMTNDAADNAYARGDGGVEVEFSIMRSRTLLEVRMCLWVDSPHRVEPPRGSVPARKDLGGSSPV